jgi:chemotaxis protein CheC
VRVVVGRELPLEDIVDLEDEALAETGNIILNSWIATIANLLKRGLKMSLPVVMHGDGKHVFESSPNRDSLVLFLHIKFEKRSMATSRCSWIPHRSTNAGRSSPTSSTA